MTWRADAVIDWLLKTARLSPQPKAFAAGISEKLVEAGAPVIRSHLSFRTLHPNTFAVTVTWEKSGQAELVMRRHGTERSSAYIGSPPQWVHQNRRNYRRRLDDVGPEDHVVLHEFKAAGHTDYILLSMNLSDGRQGLLALNTDQPGGYSDEDVAELERIVDAAAVVADLVMTRHIMANLLDTYLGAHVSRKVLDGQVRRGDGGEMDAVIFFADLRDFTRLTETLDPADMIELLNVYFETIHQACVERGGEVRRFVGDAMLVTFPETDHQDAAKRAVDAACAISQRFAAINATREIKIGFGIGLNAGRVTFGNVGAETRLDFTVMGPAVNLTQRVESLTKAAGVSVLMSKLVAEASGAEVMSKGVHQVKGVAEPVEVFAPTGCYHA